MADSIDRFFTRQVLQRLDAWRDGELVLKLPDGDERRFGDPTAGLAEIRVHDLHFFRRLALESAVGVGDAYVAGEWSTPDLPGLVAAYLRNQMHLRLGASRWTGSLLRLTQQLRHRMRRNTRRGSEHNIHAHYDLGNDFFRLFLDPSMTYSCAIFSGHRDDLEAAQQEKLHTICHKLKLQPGDRVLEIGCGWGSFSMMAAAEFDCHVTALTISREQCALVRERVAATELGDRVDVRYCDYRNVEGKFDKVASIEMLEAVGAEYWDTYFGVLDRVLVPDGLACIQVIAVPDQHFDAYRRSIDWIQTRIFPGGLLPSLLEIQRSLRRVTSLEIHDVEEIGVHYARTLRLWRERFWKNVDRVRALGLDEAFLRTWDFYLAACEASFAVHGNRDLQLVLTHPHNRVLAEQQP